MNIPIRPRYANYTRKSGPSNVEIVAESSQWYAYEIPREFANPLHRWKGQRQKWLLLRFTGEDTDVNIATEHPEFSAWRWAEPDEVLDTAAPFKSEVYRQVLQEFRWALRPLDDITGTPV